MHQGTQDIWGRNYTAIKYKTSVQVQCMKTCLDNNQQSAVDAGHVTQQLGLSRQPITIVNLYRLPNKTLLKLL